jgi:hypothetical protein
MEKPLQVFCCYARKDKDLLDELKTHLSPLQRQDVIHRHLFPIYPKQAKFKRVLENIASPYNRLIICLPYPLNDVVQ